MAAERESPIFAGTRPARAWARLGPGLLLAPLLACACAREAKPVRIAVAAPLTGDMGSEGSGLLRAVALAVEEANAAKTLPFRVEAAPFDDGADPRAAVSAANLAALDSRVAAVVGHYNSGCCIPAARVYARAGMAMLTPSATNPEVTLQQTRPDWAGPRVVFRLPPTDDVQGAFAARFVLRKLGKRTVAVVHDGTAYGGDLTGEFGKVFVRLGGKVLAVEAVPAGARDFSKPLARIRALNPGAVYFGGLYTQAGLLVRQMRRLGMKAVFVSGDGAKTPGFFDVAGPAAHGSYVSMVGAPVESLPGAAGFLERYRARWQKPGEALRPYDHFAYEAARIVLSGLERVGPDRARLLEDIRGRAHRGLSGPIVFDAKGDARDRTVVMTEADRVGRRFAVVPFAP